MAFALSNFKSNLKGGGAKSALFQVDLSYPTSITAPAVNAHFLISSTSIPASTVTTYDVFYQGKAIKVASDRTFETWETTIINDEDFGVRRSLEQWMDLLSKHELNTRSTDLTTDAVNREGENAEYKQDIQVRQYSKNGSSIAAYKFIGAFPTNIGAIPLSWEGNVIETYSCTWSYDRWENLNVGTVTANTGPGGG